MCLYLTKRLATYYFRRAIPQELQPAFEGRTEFMLSLRTKDREEAKRRRSEEAVRTDKLLADAAVALSSSAHSGPTAPRSHQFTQFEDEQAELAAQDEAEREARWEDRAPLRARLEAAFAKSTLEIRPWEAAARDLLRDVQHELTVERERSLARRVERAEERRGIMPPIRTATPSARDLRHPDGPSPAAPTGPTLDAILYLWAAERKVREKTRDAHQAAVRWFHERVGERAVSDITRKDVLAFKNSLVADNTASNSNTKLSRLQTLLQWAEDNDYREGNPAKGIRVQDNDAARRARKSFDLASLNAIFASPVYSDGARPVQGRGEAAYWLPLLGLFTGARLEELGQLTPDDIANVHYVDGEGLDRLAWVIRVREVAETGQRLKNANSERDIPVHAELEQLGFLAFAQAAKMAGQAQLFPELRPDKYGRLTAKWGEWWSLYRRDVCGVTDRRMVFHSFRHTFKDYARHAGIPEGVQRQIMGHSPGDVADEYGSGYSLHQLVEGTTLYKVPGLKLAVTSVS